MSFSPSRRSAVDPTMILVALESPAAYLYDIFSHSTPLGEYLRIYRFDNVPTTHA
ncbi:MAG: hypothetical protein ACR2IS_01690 [Nitrososphaeraceae archaeon]